MSRLRRSPDSPKRAELLDLYKASVEEYRFQIQLNWSRSQYLLAFNVAVVAAGAGLVKLGGTFGSLLTAGVFLVGFIAACLSVAVTKVQHGYYRSARDRMRRFESLLDLKQELRVDTTPAMGSPIKRMGRITTVLYLIFWVTAALDLVGVFVAVSPTRDTRVVTPAPSASPGPSPSPLSNR